MKLKCDIEISTSCRDKQLIAVLDISKLRKEAYRITCMDSNLIMLEKINNNVYTGIEILKNTEEIKKYLKINFKIHEYYGSNKN